jgi:hypothetical protein
MVPVNVWSAVPQAAPVPLRNRMLGLVPTAVRLASQTYVFLPEDNATIWTVLALAMATDADALATDGFWQGSPDPAVLAIVFDDSGLKLAVSAPAVGYVDEQA